MPSFQLDHNVSVHLRFLLRAAGHDVTDAREQGLDRAPDPEMLLEAAQAGRILVTHNQRHFTMLHHAWRRWPIAWGVSPPPAHAGILLPPQPPHATPVALAQAIVELLAASMPLANHLWRWEPATGWIVEPTRPDEVAPDH